MPSMPTRTAILNPQAIPGKACTNQHSLTFPPTAGTKYGLSSGGG